MDEAEAAVVEHITVMKRVEAVAHRMRGRAKSVSGEGEAQEADAAKLLTMASGLLSRSANVRSLRGRRLLHVPALLGWLPFQAGAQATDAARWSARTPAPQPLLPVSGRKTTLMRFVIATASLQTFIEKASPQVGAAQRRPAGTAA